MTDRETFLLVAGALVLFLVLCLPPSSSSTRSLHLVEDAYGNESLVMNGTIAHEQSLFVVDTAYAGAPVLSTSYLAIQQQCTSSSRGCDGSVQSRYQKSLKLLKRGVDDWERRNAVARLLTNNTCRSFTAGCTQRLMSISTTVETQADLLLCPSLQFDGVVVEGSLNADVFVTNPLPSSPHILTCDYLLHRPPCILRPSEGTISFGNTGAQSFLSTFTFEFFPAVLVGGAFAVDVLVGKTPLKMVVDTGASSCVSVGRKAAETIRRCKVPDDPRKVTQRGVNSDRVCSDVLRAEVSIGSTTFSDVEVFANSQEVEMADGYLGLGILRCFDLWLEPGRIGFRPSGLTPKVSRSTSRGSCGGPSLSCG